MGCSIHLSSALLVAAALWLSGVADPDGWFAGSNCVAEARVSRRSAGGHRSAPTSAGHRSRKSKGSPVASAPEPKSGHKHHHGGTPHAKPSTRYAYPMDFFMMSAPEFDRTPLDEQKAHKLKNAFDCGIAENASPTQLVRAGVFKHYPLSGGIFRRREPVKYIILHSTETGIPVPAKNVINGWNSGGRRHAGAQFVVDRDGTIYQAVDPELATVHVNIFKTLPGINNDNTVGIEMNHTGRQDYPAELRAAVIRLVCYLQDRFSVSADNVITHKYAQQGDHTDPVNMDVEAFLATKESFRQKAIAMKRVTTPVLSDEETEDDAPLASVYVQIHGQIKLEPEGPVVTKPSGAGVQPSQPGSRSGESVPHSVLGSGQSSSSNTRVESPLPTPGGASSRISPPSPGAATTINSAISGKSSTSENAVPGNSAGAGKSPTAGNSVPGSSLTAGSPTPGNSVVPGRSPNAGNSPVPGNSSIPVNSLAPTPGNAPGNSVPANSGKPLTQSGAPVPGTVNSGAVPPTARVRSSLEPSLIEAPASGSGTPISK